jgi:NAD(P)-dependent dehydrogenase (short-subunit alcohol dehydrogenase family)
MGLLVIFGVVILIGALVWYLVTPSAPADRVTIDKVRIAQWKRLIDVDLTGVFMVSRAASAAMIPNKYGRIINISSVLGLVPMRLQSAYVAAKAGVANLTKGMAIELAQHGITVNAIAPGSTATDGWRNWINDATSEERDLHARLMSHIPMGRPAETREIAHAALFLADPDSAFVTELERTNSNLGSAKYRGLVE